jgi:hypothetical protein
MTVVLSGGEYGGTEIDSVSWSIGEQKVFGNHIYVLVTENLACFNGYVS